MTLPLADAAALRGVARRTAAIRLALGAAVTACVAVSLALSQRDFPPSAVAATGGANTEVVLDLSGSVADISSPQVLRALERTASTARRVGLVVFSDVAEEILPPGTPSRELRKVFRYFEPLHGHVYGKTPWSQIFTSGTSISSGIAAARRALERDGIGGSVVLVSDGGDSVADLPALRRQLVALARDPVTFRFDLLKGSIPVDLPLYRRVFGRNVVRREAIPPRTATRTRHGSQFPLLPVVLAGIAAGALATRELVAVSLRWRAA
jgi:hypothetical protein